MGGQGVRIAIKYRYGKMLRLLSVLVDGIFRFYVEQHINLALNFQPFFMGYPPLPFIHGLPGADHYNFPRCIDVLKGLSGYIAGLIHCQRSQFFKKRHQLAGFLRWNGSFYDYFHCHWRSP